MDSGGSDSPASRRSRSPVPQLRRLRPLPSCTTTEHEPDPSPWWEPDDAPAESSVPLPPPLPPPGNSRERMLALGVCEKWLQGHCLGPPGCSLRYPRWQGPCFDLFYDKCCRKFQRNACHGDRGCTRLHLPVDTWEQDLTTIVGVADATWDWTQNEGLGVELPPTVAEAAAMRPGETHSDMFLRLLMASTVLDRERVLNGMLELVRGDGSLERYLMDTLNSLRG